MRKNTANTPRRPMIQCGLIPICSKAIYKHNTWIEVGAAKANDKKAISVA